MLASIVTVGNTEESRMRTMRLLADALSELTSMGGDGEDK